MLRCFHIRLWKGKIQLNYTWKQLVDDKEEMERDKLEPDHVKVLSLYNSYTLFDGLMYSWVSCA